MWKNGCTQSGIRQKYATRGILSREDIQQCISAERILHDETRNADLQARESVGRWTNLVEIPETHRTVSHPLRVGRTFARGAPQRQSRCGCVLEVLCEDDRTQSIVNE